MRVAYLVLSYRDPQQVLRLVRVLNEGPAAVVAVRHDPRRQPLDDEDLRAAGALALSDDVAVGWAEPSQLEMVLGAMRAVVDRLDPDWLVLLSAQDYPLRPLAEIEAGLSESPHQALLGNPWPLPLDRLPAPPQREFFLRYAYRHVALPFVPRLPRRLLPLAYRRELPPPSHPRLGLRRLRPPHSPLYVSSDWLTLERRGLHAVLQAADGPLGRLFRTTVFPTEAFYASAVMADGSLSIGTDHRRFIRFARAGAPRPDVLTAADLPELEASGADFARKFDPRVDGRVLDLLDARRSASTA